MCIKSEITGESTTCHERYIIHILNHTSNYDVTVPFSPHDRHMHLLGCPDRHRHLVPKMPSTTGTSR